MKRGRVERHYSWSLPHPQKILLKINFNILTFYIKSIIFYHFLNKKYYKTKFFIFYIKHYYFFLLYQSYLLQYRSTSNSHMGLFGDELDRTQLKISKNYSQNQSQYSYFLYYINHFLLLFK